MTEHTHCLKLKMDDQNDGDDCDYICVGGVEMNVMMMSVGMRDNGESVGDRVVC